MATRRSYDSGGMMFDEEEYTADWNDPAPPQQYQSAPTATHQQSGNGYNPSGSQYGLPAAPGNQSWTNYINSQNPEKDPAKSYDQYDSIFPGRSINQATAYNQYNDAVGQIGQGWVDDFLARNPGDTNRIMEAYQSERTGGGDGGGGDGGWGGGGGNGGGGGGGDNDLAAALKGLWGGGMNQDIINRRVSNASDTLNRFRKSQNATNQAALANRGLIGSGPEHTAMDSMEGDIADRFSNAVNGIWADEAENADDRMMQALGLSVGRESDQGQLDIARSRLSLDEMLGMGGLALGNMNAVNDYNLGVGRLGLDRDLGLANLENMDLDRLIDAIRDWQRSADGSANGFE
jgi:hypothetical protein